MPFASFWLDSMFLIFHILWLDLFGPTHFHFTKVRWLCHHRDWLPVLARAPPEYWIRVCFSMVQYVSMDIAITITHNFMICHIFIKICKSWTLLPSQTGWATAWATTRKPSKTHRVFPGEGRNSNRSGTPRRPGASPGAGLGANSFENRLDQVWKAHRNTQ